MNEYIIKQKYRNGEDIMNKYEVNYTDNSGVTSPIDTIIKPEGYTAEQYMEDCKENADDEWNEMLSAGSVRLTVIDDGERYIKINGAEYTEGEFMQEYYSIYGDNASLDDPKEYIQELNLFAEKNKLDDLKIIMIQHGIENGYLDKPEMIYTVWCQVLNKDGSINNEYIMKEFKSLEDAVKYASDDDIIRISPHYHQYTREFGFWDAIEKLSGATDDYTEFDSNGKIR